MEFLPDLTTFGKIIGGGLPVGAYGGPKEIMDMVAPLGPVYQAGTLSGNPLAMAAGLATLRYLRSHKSTIYTALEIRSAELVEGVTAAAKDAEVPICYNRVGSMFTWFFTASPVTDWTSAAKCDTQSFRPILSRHAGQGHLPATITVRSGIPERSPHAKRCRADNRGGEASLRDDAVRQVRNG